MKIVVDTNIVFSAILNTKSKIAEILFNSDEYFTFYSPVYMKEEIFSYFDKLQQCSKLSNEEILQVISAIFDKLTLIDEALIKPSSWETAYNLCSEIDEDDTPFIALSIEIDAILWTGDKKLMSGLQKKNWDNILNTDTIQLFRQ